MKRIWIWGALLGLFACAPKKENPAIIGVSFDRLYQEGWEAYAQSDYATAEAKFDSILKYVDASNPEVYLAAALAQVPLRKFSQADANAGIALALLGDPFTTEDTLPLAQVFTDATAPFEGHLVLSSPFLPVDGVRLEGYWMGDILLLDPSGRTRSDAIANGWVPLGLVGEEAAFRLMGWQGETLYVATGDDVGATISTVDLVDSSTVTLVEETVYYVPGETVVVDTQYVYSVVSVDRQMQPPVPGDAFNGVLLVRNSLSSLSDLHILAYQVRGMGRYIQGQDNPGALPVALAYFDAALQLISEKGGYTFAPVEGVLNWSAYFSECAIRLEYAKAAADAGLFYNAATRLNPVLTGAGQSPIAPVLTPSAAELQALFDAIQVAKGICGQS